MTRYWENQSGIYDPTVKQIIEKDNKKSKRKRANQRRKEVNQTITEIKKLLESRDLMLMERVILKDKRSGKIYR